MADEDELLRAMEMSGWLYEIRRGDAPHRLRVLLEVGHTENGVFQWHPFYGLFQRGKPSWHSGELAEAVAELRAEDRRRRWSNPDAPTATWWTARRTNASWLEQGGEVP